MSQPAVRAALRVLVLPVRRHPTRLTYYHVIQPPPSPLAAGDAAQSGSSVTRLLKRGVGKAVELWDSFGDEKRPATSWQRRVYSFGTMAMDRVPFEESALKALDVARLGDARDNAIVLLHPASEGSSVDVKARWAAFLAERVPLHRRGMTIWGVVAPFTAPFMIVPIVPNLPFFFCVWRAWSHYSAMRSAKLLADVPLTTEHSAELDAVFSPSEKPAAETTEADKAADADAGGLLTVVRAEAVTKHFALPPHTHSELLRAVAQAVKRTESEAKR